MSETSSAVGIFETHLLAEAAVKELQSSGLDIAKLSIIGREDRTNDDVVGYYNTGERMMAFGKQGAFWGGAWGMLLGAGFFWVPGLGPLLVAGPLVSTIIFAIEGVCVAEGVSAVGAGLDSLGIPKKNIPQYEAAIKAGKYVLIFLGTVEEVEKGRQILEGAKAVEATVFVQAPVAAV